MRNCGVLVALVLLSLATPLARADIAATSTSQTVSASGVTEFFPLPIECEIYNLSCYPPPGGLLPGGQQYNNTASNSTLPPVNLSESGSAQALPPYLDGRNISAQSSASQTVNVTPNQISLDLETVDQASGFSELANWQAAGSSEFSVTFDLTGAAVVDLSGTASGEVGGAPGQQISFLQITFLLSSPGGFQSGETFPLTGASPFETSFDDPVFLNPGSYTLTADVTGSLTLGDFTGFDVVGGGLTLNADFTDVPEPRWSFVVPLALLVVLWRPLRARSRS